MTQKQQQFWQWIISGIVTVGLAVGSAILSSTWRVADIAGITRQVERTQREEIRPDITRIKECQAETKTRVAVIEATLQRQQQDVIAELKAIRSAVDR